MPEKHSVRETIDRAAVRDPDDTVKAILLELKYPDCHAARAGHDGSCPVTDLRVT
jgi:hypothetical protein